MEWVKDWSLVLIPVLLTGIGTLLVWVLTDRAKVEVRLVRLEDAQIGFSRQLDSIASDIREIRRFIEGSITGHRK